MAYVCLFFHDSCFDKGLKSMDVVFVPHFFLKKVFPFAESLHKCKYKTILLKTFSRKFQS